MKAHGNIKLISLIKVSIKHSRSKLQKMTIQPIKTPLIKPKDDLKKIISKNIKSIPENSVLAIVSKAFSFCENRFVPKITGTKEEKNAIIKDEAERYLEASVSRYGLIFTIKEGVLFVNAGVDESNSENMYTLWPEDPQKSVNDIWEFLRSHYGLKNVGVIMTDSKSMPLSWGVIGHAIKYCGFNPLKDYRGTEDLYGRKMVMEQLNLAQCLASAAVLEMGEGSERQPMALITDIKQDMIWQDHVPTQAELDNLKISLEDDAFEPMLAKQPWKKK